MHQSRMLGPKRLLKGLKTAVSVANQSLVTGDRTGIIALAGLKPGWSRDVDEIHRLISSGESPQKTGPRPSFDGPRALSLFEQGKSRMEIARLLGVQYEAVRRYIANKYGAGAGPSGGLGIR